MSAEHAGTRKWKNKSVKKESKPDAPLLEPITHPLYGSVPAQTAPMNSNNPPNTGYPLPGQQFSNSALPPPPPTSGFGQPAPPVPQMLSQSASPFPTNFAPNNFNQNAVSGMNFNQNAVSNIGVPSGPAEEPVIPKPAQKLPIPEQHIHMKTVFDALREKCSCTTNNPQTKRKLEDVGRKLETLYDYLREQTLSQNTLSSLHQIVALIQQGNYNGCLQLCGQLASGPDFSQIASFMPGIKILLTCASQLQVYLS